MNEQKERSRGNFTLTMLIAMVTGSMVGAGVLSLPHRFASSQGVFAILIAWLSAGAGRFMLALVFQNHTSRKPGINAGVFAHSKEGFWDFPGFLSNFGYRSSA